MADPGKKSSTGKGGTKKYDRNRKWCEAYRARSQREVNRACRWLRWLRRDARAGHPAPVDTGVIERGLAALPASAVKRAQRIVKKDLKSPTPITT